MAKKAGKIYGSERDSNKSIYIMSGSGGGGGSSVPSATLLSSLQKNSNGSN